MLRKLLVAAVLALVASQGAEAEDFYRGKTLRLIVPSAPGGGYDAYGRTLAQYMARHIPGEPTIVVQNMPGGGGLTGANWLFNIAPKDGTVFGLIQRGVPFYPFFGDKNAMFKPMEVNWLGSMTAEVGAVWVFHTSKAKTIEDAFKMEVVLGGSGPNDSETYPNLMNNTIGTKFRVVSGYKANTETLLAIERGEVEGLSGSWSSVKANRPSWVKDNQVRPLVQIAGSRQPDLPDVPLILDLVKRRRPRDVAGGAGDGAGGPAGGRAAGSAGRARADPAQGFLGYDAGPGLRRRHGKRAPRSISGNRRDGGAAAAGRIEDITRHAVQAAHLYAGKREVAARR